MSPKPSKWLFNIIGGRHERNWREFSQLYFLGGSVGSRVDNVLDSGAGGPGLKSQPRRSRVTVLRKLFTPIVPLFTKQQNW